MPAYSSFSSNRSCNQTNSSCWRTTEKSALLNSGSVVWPHQTHYKWLAKQNSFSLSISIMHMYVTRLILHFTGIQFISLRQCFHRKATSLIQLTTSSSAGCGKEIISKFVNVVNAHGAMWSMRIMSDHSFAVWLMMLHLAANSPSTFSCRM